MLKHSIFFLAGLSLLSEVTAQVPAYPLTRRVEQTDNYFGTTVADPYRWLEDDRSAETAAWVKEENAVTEAYMSQIPYRGAIKQRLTTLWNFAKQTAPVKNGTHYFYYANDGLQNQFVLKMQDGMDGKPVVLVDPNAMAGGGTTHINDYSISKDGHWVAYSISTAGSDWSEIYVIDTRTREVQKDQLKWIKFSGIAWRGNGFYYSRYAAPDSANLLKGKNEYHKLYYHRVGTTQSSDSLVYEDRAHPQRNFTASVTDDERYLVLYTSEASHGNEVSVKDLSMPGSVFIPLMEGFDATSAVIGNAGDRLFMLTDKEASRNKLVTMPADRPAEMMTLIPESEDVLESAVIANNMLVTSYMKDASSRIRVFNLEGGFLVDVPLPSLGYVNELSAERKDENVFFSYTSYTVPATIYRFNLNTRQSSIFFKPQMDFDDSKYETYQVFYPSKDGTSIPMFITHKKGLERNGNNPVLLFGYGGFNVSRTPEFKIERLVFLENGGVFAAPCLRGGGEYGEAWHEAGTKLQKQNVFDDFIAAAEYMVSEKYTQPSKMAIGGRSNGGLLVGACMTQRPDLFKVALPQVGVMDMLRYHTFTIGWAWKGDYGSSEDSVNFKNLYSYSPLHNIRDNVSYPATLVFTGDHDDRVVPAHSFKFIATLQEKNKGTNPVLIRVDMDAGHAAVTLTGSSKPVAKQIDEFTDMFAFAMYNLGMQVKY